MFKVVPVSPVSKIRKFNLCPSICVDLESAMKEFASYKLDFGVTCNIVSYE